MNVSSFDTVRFGLVNGVDYGPRIFLDRVRSKGSFAHGYMDVSSFIDFEFDAADHRRCR